MNASESRRPRHRLAIATSLVAMFALASSNARAQLSSITSLDKEFTALVKRVAPAVVLVDVGPKLSGVVIHSSGFVLTDASVARFMQEARPPRDVVTVVFTDRRSYPARLVKVDAETGSAMLKIDQKSLPAVRPGDPGQLEIGNFLLTIGNAFGSAEESTPAVTLGVVSDVHLDPANHPLLIETSAATNPGQNGGPYFDVDGNLVGLARSLPNGQDLATVTPIDRLRNAYRDLADAARVFPPPSSVRPPDSKGRTLSRAFHLAAERGRAGIVTVIVTRRPKEDPAPTTASAPVPGDGTTPPAPTAPEPPAPLVPKRAGPLTGTIVDATGFVAAPEAAFTDDVETIEVVLHDGRRYRASVVGRDKKCGLALLLVDKPASDLLQPQDDLTQDQLAVGQFVVAIGAPNAPGETLGPFTTVGILSNTHRLDGWVDALQTDAGVNVKNAGGLLVDLRGRALGVLLPPVAPYGQNSGLGFAMPMDALKKSIRAMVEGRVIEPGYLGVTLGDDRGGVIIASVTKGFPAETAGLQIGDVITRVNQTEVRSRQEFSDVIATRFSAGDTITLAVRRGAGTIEIRLELARRP